MLRMGAEALLTHGSKSQVICMEKMLRKFETPGKGILNPNLRPLSDMSTFLISLIFFYVLYGLVGYELCFSAIVVPDPK